MEEMFELTLKNTNKFDKTYMRFCKYVLGVHSKACNFAIISTKAVLLLWFLTVTCSCCPYLYFGSAVMLVTYFVNSR